MTYDNIVHGIFLRRLNRFVCEVQVNGEVFPAHVRNTGRCTGIIAAGAEVSLQRSTDSSRKTPFTLIAVSTPQYGWVNIDSLAPNVMAGEWLSKQGFEVIHPEYPFGESRIDFTWSVPANGTLWRSRAARLRKTGSVCFRTHPRSAAQSIFGSFPKQRGRGTMQ